MAKWLVCSGVNSRNSHRLGLISPLKHADFSSPCLVEKDHPRAVWCSKQIVSLLPFNAPVPTGTGVYRCSYLSPSKMFTSETTGPLQQDKEIRGTTSEMDQQSGIVLERKNWWARN